MKIEPIIAALNKRIDRGSVCSCKTFFFFFIDNASVAFLKFVERLRSYVNYGHCFGIEVQRTDCNCQFIKYFWKISVLVDQELILHRYCKCCLFKVREYIWIPIQNVLTRTFIYSSTDLRFFSHILRQP